MGSAFPNVPPVAEGTRAGTREGHHRNLPPTVGRAVVVISVDQVNVLVNGTSPNIPPKPARPASRSSSRVEPVARGTPPTSPQKISGFFGPATGEAKTQSGGSGMAAAIHPVLSVAAASLAVPDPPRLSTMRTRGIFFVRVLRSGMPGVRGFRASSAR